MSFDFKKLLEFTESDDFEQGTSVVNKLLSHWSIPRWKDAESNKDWTFIFRHRDVLSDILALSGYSLVVVEARGREMAFINMNEAEATFQKFNKSDATVFLCMRVLYEEHMRKVSLDANALNAKITVDDLLTTVCAYKKNTNMRTEMKEIRSILFKLEALNICRVEGTRKDFGPESLISVFPTITALLPSASIEDITALLDDYKAETNKKLYLTNDDQDEENDVSNGYDNEE